VKLAPLAPIAIAVALAAPARADDPQKRTPTEQSLFYVASIGWAGMAPIFADGLAHQDNAYASVDFGADLLVPLIAPAGIALRSSSMRPMAGGAASRRRSRRACCSVSAKASR
jgi:hypothetical protein